MVDSANKYDIDSDWHEVDQVVEEADAV